MRLAPLALAALVALAFSGCFRDAGDPPAAAAGPMGDLDAATFGLRPVVDGLERPVFLTHAGDRSGDLYVLEQAGRVRVVRDGGLDPEPFLDIRGLVSSGGERGLLGLAFDPDYPENRRFYVHYTDNDGDTVLARYLATCLLYTSPSPRDRG